MRSATSSVPSKKIKSLPFFHFCRRSDGLYSSDFFLYQNWNRVLMAFKGAVKWYEYRADNV